MSRAPFELTSGTSCGILADELFAADSIDDGLEDVAVDVRGVVAVCFEEDTERRGGALGGKVMAILV